MKIFLLLVLSQMIVSNAAFAGESVIAPGSVLKKVVGDCKFTEGPACDADGNVFFTDQPNDRILKYGTDGKLSTFMQPCGRSNGLCFDAKGNLWACADEKNELWVIDGAGKVTVVVKDYQGKLLNGPNDVWLRPGGGAYFTDPFYKRDYWKRGPNEQGAEAVYYLAPDRKTVTRVVDDMKQPNGIIGTPDGKTLYVSDIGGHKTYVYDIQPDGSLKNKRLFCELGSDGMTIDDEGNVYLTGKGVTGLRQDREAHRKDRRPGALDRQRLLRRQGPADAFHHRQHQRLHPLDAREGRRQSVSIGNSPRRVPGAANDAPGIFRAQGSRPGVLRPGVLTTSPRILNWVASLVTSCEVVTTGGLEFLAAGKTFPMFRVMARPRGSLSPAATIPKCVGSPLLNKRSREIATRRLTKDAQASRLGRLRLFRQSPQGFSAGCCLTDSRPRTRGETRGSGPPHPLPSPDSAESLWSPQRHPAPG